MQAPPASQRAMVALCTCANTSPSPRSLPGSGSAEPTAHAYTSAVIRRCSPNELRVCWKVLREHDPNFILLDGTLAECDRIGERTGRLLPQAPPARHVTCRFTDPDGRLLWLSPLRCRAGLTT